MSPLSDDDITWLLQLLEQEELAEVEVEGADWRVRVRRSPPAPSQEVSTPAAEAAAESLPEDLVPLLAPMSGIFYRAPSPDSPPYTEEGQRVERGDVVGLIEAMKVFNEIEAPVDGIVTQILVRDGQPVEAYQRLMLIRVTH
jgi:acetyl-CoA carboxylase biotin carboxyl carrier protein